MDRRKVMVVDRSGRGHAIADLFTRTNPNVEVTYVPGCSAINDPRIHCRDDIRLNDFDALVALAKAESVDMVFVANTAALVDGLVDRLRLEGIVAIGPDRAASRLEASKVDTKALCVKYGIPVAEHASFDTAQAARAYVAGLAHDVVVKADGLCGGNGSYVCGSKAEANMAIDAIMVDKEYGDAGNRVVIEKRLPGIEISYFALFDGKTFKPLPMALDYKRADDGNVGPNGGGMGSLSPHPLEGSRLDEMMAEQVLTPLERCIEGEKLNYNGIIYVGAMLSEGEIKVLEFNVRLGDPEAEVVLPRIDTDFIGVCDAIVQRRLDQCEISISPSFHCNVVATQGRTRQIGSDGRNKGWYKGWPHGRYGKGYAVSGIDAVNSAAARVFIGEAAVDARKGLISDGGRVIHVVGVGDTKEEAMAHAYGNIDKVRFEGMRYRSDIGTIYNNKQVLQDAEIKAALDISSPARATSREQGASVEATPKGPR